MINVIVCDDYNQLSNVAFEIMSSVIKNKADATLGLATGSSPIGLYQNMIADYDKKKTSYKMIKTFNLDEYVGIDVHHPESYYSFMHRNLFDHIDIEEKNIHIPSNMGDDLQKNCDDYNKLLADNDTSLVPKKAITMGIANVMAARKILLLATGENKAEAIYQTIKGKIDESCPSTILQRHNDVTIVVDKLAASKL